ncbi:hypothetical protein B5D77_01510 [Microcystis sp. MC19]|nr:hypothetical protein B5D77_01510 [Microcystis sp. MC19]
MPQFFSYQESGDRRQEIGDRRLFLFILPTPHTPHPTPHTLPPPKSFLPQTQLSIRIWPKQPDSKQRKTNGRYRF